MAQEMTTPVMKSCFSLGERSFGSKAMRNYTFPAGVSAAPRRSFQRDGIFRVPRERARVPARPGRAQRSRLVRGAPRRLGQRDHPGDAVVVRRAGVAALRPDAAARL